MDWQVIPFVWQDTATQTLTNKFKELTAQISLRVQGCPAERRIDLVTLRVRQLPVPSYFRRLQVTQKALDNMHVRNKECPLSAQFSVEHMVGGVVRGMQLREHPSLDLPLTQGDVVRMWGSVSWVLADAQLWSAA